MSYRGGIVWEREWPRREPLETAGWKCPNKQKGEEGHDTFNVCYKELTERATFANNEILSSGPSEVIAREIYNLPLCLTCGAEATEVRRYRKKTCPICNKKIAVAGPGRKAHFLRHTKEDGIVEIQPYPDRQGEHFFVPRDRVNDILRSGNYKVVK
jgi:DNA-directed RNA polymerase subunit RPC12/RpoP